MCLVGFVMAGCESVDSDTQEHDTNEKVRSDILPLEGEWVAFDGRYLENSCYRAEIPDGMTVIGDLSLVSSQEIELLVLPTDTSVFNCSLAQGAYDCGTTEQVIDHRPSIDLVLTYSETLNGTFENEAMGTFEFSMGLTCEGADCSMLEGELGFETGIAVSFPCVSRGTGQIVHKDS